MGGGFRELPGITADQGIEAWGDTPEEAFAQAVAGLSFLLVDRSLLFPRATRESSVRSPSREGLLVALLNEVVFLAETGEFITREARSVRFASAGEEGEEAVAVLAGEPFDPSRHRRLSGIKAATWHDLSIVTSPGGRTAVRVIFDA